MAVILIVDDDQLVVEMIAGALRPLGHSVDTLDDGLHVIDVVHLERPALVILDVMIPGLSGIDVLREIRESGAATVPVLLLSAKSRDSDVDTGFAVGADDYVIKPFSPRELLHRVNGILARVW